MTNNVTIDWSADINVDDEEVYESLLRAIGRTEGFGLFFVRCVEKDRAKLEQRLRGDLPRLRLDRLELKEDLKDGNLYRRLAEVEQQLGPLNGLFISGLEKSLDPYVKSGYGGLGDYYNKDTVPRVLGHLNLQRERFRDDFPFCLIFFLSAFGIKYIARRAPDFFDWRSGLFEFVADEAKLGRLTKELWGDYTEYLTWTETQRLDRIREIQALIDEDRQTPSGKASLFFEKAKILITNESYEEAISSFDRIIELMPDDYFAWDIRGRIFDLLNRYEEAIASYDKAIKSYNNALGFKSLEVTNELWNSRGVALSNLNRYEEAIISYNNALQLQPNDHEAWYNLACAHSLLGEIDFAVTDLTEALRLNPEKYQELAIANPDLEPLREDPRFAKLLGLATIS
jgi:tetratricopeptide (TPR) repeat protein